MTTLTSTAAATSSRSRSMNPSTAPDLPEELLAVLKRMRLPYLRNAAPEMLATARAQRWDPAEVLRVLISEEIRGRDDATRRMRRKAAGLPAGQDLRVLARARLLHPTRHPDRAGHPGVGRPGGESRDRRTIRHREDALRRSAGAQGHRRPGCGSPGSPWSH